MKRFLFTVGLLLLILPVVQADVTLSGLFNDHMVLQRDQANYLWGWADVGEAIEVGFDGHTLSTTGSAEGTWYVMLPKAGLGDAKTITVQGKNTVIVNDILMGDVWVCSGQSNMEWRLRQLKDMEKDIESADYPDIRYYLVPRKVALSEQSDVDGAWVSTTPERVIGFSAVAYFFGRSLHRELDVPIGLISSSWGGTPIEPWISQGAMAHSETYTRLNELWRPDMEQYGDTLYSYFTHTGKDRVSPPPIKRAFADSWPTAPSFTYNAMIAPLWRYGIKGAIWYQGESNASRAYQYRDLMQTMITDWRNQFGQGEFPFIITQLANFKARDAEPVESDWAELREAQSMAAAEMRNVGIATIIDIGEAKDIHPRNKQDVGYRLAQSALHIAYGQKKVLPAGPTYKSMKVKGDKIVLKFDHVNVVMAVDGDEVKGFSIAGADQKFVWADAKVNGKKIVVSSDEVKMPVAVRYGWANNPECNLYNLRKREIRCLFGPKYTIHLPASPFRTDDFPMITRDAE